MKPVQFKIFTRVPSIAVQDVENDALDPEILSRAMQGGEVVLTDEDLGSGEESEDEEELEESEGAIEEDEEEDSDDFHSELPYGSSTLQRTEFFEATLLGISKVSGREGKEIVIVSFCCLQGLPNFEKFNTHMERIEIIHRRKDYNFSVMSLDVDHEGDNDIWFSDRFISQQTDQDFQEEHEGHKVMALKFTVDKTTDWGKSKMTQAELGAMNIVDLLMR